MNFGFTEEQEMIRSQAAEFLKQEYPIAFVREWLNDEHGFNQDLWNKMSTLGWIGLVFPEHYRGAGLTFVDLTILLEQMGRALVPGAFFSTVLLGGLTIFETANAEQKLKWLTSIADGKLKTTLAHIEPEADGNADGSSFVTAKREDNGYVLNGTKLFVPDAHSADLILCTARFSGSRNPKEGISLFAVDRTTAGLNLSALKTMDQTRRLYEVTFHQVYVPKILFLVKLEMRHLQSKRYFARPRLADVQKWLAVRKRCLICALSTPSNESSSAVRLVVFRRFSISVRTCFY